MPTTLHRRFAVLAAAGAAVTALLVAPLTAFAATSGTDAASQQGIPMWMVMPLGIILAFVAEMVVLVFRVSDTDAG
jgi:hypothetical protein